MSIINRITNRMSEIGITKAELQKRSNLKKSTFYNIFDPKTNENKLALETIRAIAIALNTNIDYLINGLSEQHDLIVNKGEQSLIYKFRLLNEFAQEKVSDYLDDYFLWKRKNKISSAFLFGGDKPIAETTLRRSFSQYTHEAGLKRIRVHDLRHSYVSMLKHIGLDNKIIASLIGDTEEQVIKTYAHLYNDDKENAIDFLNAELGKKLGKIN